MLLSILVFFFSQFRILLVSDLEPRGFLVSLQSPVLMLSVCEEETDNSQKREADDWFSCDNNA